MIHHTDCLEFMRGMVERGERVDAIITDPPYELSNNGGIGKGEFSSRQLVRDKHIDWISRGFDYISCFELFLAIQDIPNMLIFCSNQQVSKTMGFFEEKGLSVTLLVWQKTNPIPLCNNNHLSDCEFVVYVRGKGATFNNDTPFDYKKKVYTSPIVPSKDRLHPTQKSVEHLQQYIALHTNKGDTIFDPFMGSGSTGVASLIEGRKFIGCEIDSEYFEIAKRRVEGTDKTLRQSLFYGID